MRPNPLMPMFTILESRVVFAEQKEWFRFAFAGCLRECLATLFELLSQSFASGKGEIGVMACLHCVWGNVSTFFRHNLPNYLGNLLFEGKY